MKIRKRIILLIFLPHHLRLKRQVEAILFAASEPLDIETIEKRLQTTANLKKYWKIFRNLQKKRLKFSMY